MRFTATAATDPRATLKGTEEQVARSVTAGMHEIATGLKQDLRDDVREAGLGPRLANTWRGAVYPKAGASMEAAAYVSTNAPKLIDAFDRGVVIRARSRVYLAIPTPEAGVRQVSKRRSKGSTDNTLTPAAWERETGVKLRFVPSKGGGGVLVADGFYRRQARRVQGRKSFRPIRESGPDRGRSFVVVFVLAKQAKIRKRLDIDATAKRWADRVPAAISANWEL